MAIFLHKPAYLHKIGKRKNNEDSIFPLENEAKVGAENNLFLVCDGVGGANKGEIASQLVCTHLSQYVAQNENATKNADFFKDGLEYVEQKLTEHVHQHPECVGMATTLTLLYFNHHNNTATIAWSGDSRVYHIRNGHILFQTTDHSLVNEFVKRGDLTPEEARTHPQRNVILRAVSGSDYPTELDVHENIQVLAGDYFLLCSDGILESVDDALIKQLLPNANQTVEEVSQKIEEQCQQFSNDNFSMYLLQVAQITTPTENINTGSIKTTVIQTENNQTQIIENQNVKKVIANNLPTQVETITPSNTLKNTTEQQPYTPNNNKKIIYLLTILALTIGLALIVYRWYNNKMEQQKYQIAFNNAETLFNEGNTEQAVIEYQTAYEIAKKLGYPDTTTIKIKMDSIATFIQDQLVLKDLLPQIQQQLDSFPTVKKWLDTTYQIEKITLPQLMEVKNQIEIARETRKTAAIEQKNTEPAPKTPAEKPKAKPE